MAQKEGDGADGEGRCGGARAQRLSLRGICAEAGVKSAVGPGAAPSPASMYEFVFTMHSDCLLQLFCSQLSAYQIIKI